MNLEDVARIAGVSRSTVSRVINDDPRVSGAVRLRVQDVIVSTNYHPNKAARSLVTRRTGNVGLVFPRAFASMLSDPWSSALVKACLDGSEAVGLNMMLILESTENPIAASRFYERLIREQHLDGIVMASHDINDALIDRLLEGVFPSVLIGRDLANRANFVDVDSRAAARQATRHLVEHGRRRIATISGPANLVTACDRHDGFIDGLTEAGLEPFSPGAPLTASFSQREAASVACALLSGPDHPDAIFAANDAMAIGVLQAAGQLGIHVPDDLAVIGFDDVPINHAYQIELTTIRQPTEELGHRAMSLLATMIPAPAQTPIQEWMEAPLIRRGSCGCPPAYPIEDDGIGKEGGSLATAVTGVMIQT